jgi:hypothetical protein
MASPGTCSTPPTAGAPVRRTGILHGGVVRRRKAGREGPPTAMRSARSHAKNRRPLAPGRGWAAHRLGESSTAQRCMRIKRADAGSPGCLSGYPLHWDPTPCPVGSAERPAHRRGQRASGRRSRLFRGRYRESGSCLRARPVPTMAAAAGAPPVCPGRHAGVGGVVGQASHDGDGNWCGAGHLGRGGGGDLGAGDNRSGVPPSGIDRDRAGDCLGGP